jgi:hypothetical protein
MNGSSLSSSTSFICTSYIIALLYAIACLFASYLALALIRVPVRYVNVAECSQVSVVAVRLKGFSESTRYPLRILRT